jgi:hypothetical protein
MISGMAPTGRPTSDGDTWTQQTEDLTELVSDADDLVASVQRARDAKTPAERARCLRLLRLREHLINRKVRELCQL